LAICHFVDFFFSTAHSTDSASSFLPVLIEREDSRLQVHDLFRYLREKILCNKALYLQALSKEVAFEVKEESDNDRRV
jgi:hypothetical protein